MSSDNALISTHDLATRLDDPDLAIVEVDEDTTAYTAGHIPGSVSLDWENDLHDLPRRDFVSADQLAGLLGSKGISSEQTMVLYGGNNNWFAAYAYWLCKLRGIDNVMLLDGEVGSSGSSRICPSPPRPRRGRGPPSRSPGRTAPSFAPPATK